MKFGFCTGKDGIGLALKAGCDYLEMGFTAVARMSDGEFAETAEAVEASGLAVEAMNGFIPGDFPLCTLETWDGVLDYVEKGMARARRLGVQVVVFGSGAARHIPEGTDKDAALARLADFLHHAAEIAGRYGIRIAVEPLCHAEDNAVNTVLEGWALARASGSAHAAALADLYHMGQNGEDVGELMEVGADLIHCHIGRPGDRKYPLPGDGYDYGPFFGALKAIGYTGRVSVEAAWRNGPEDIVDSITYLRSLGA